MPLQGFAALSCTNIPEFDGAVETTTEKGLSIGTKNDRKDSILVSRQRSQMLSREDIP
jgi:hypothetical protein